MRDADHLKALFDRLEAWRHYPAYRLEPRVDAIFSLYMRPVVEAHTGCELLNTILPELPIRRGTLFGETTASPNKSVKVDFVLFGADRRTVYFVELKTDLGSRRERQDNYLKKCTRIGFSAIVDGIISVVRTTERKYVRKYLHLLRALERLGFVSVPAAVGANAFPSPRAELVALLRQIAAIPPVEAPQIKVIFVQPKPDPQCDSVTFEEFACIVAESPDPLSQEFAKRLLKWCDAAGSTNPWESDTDA